MDERRVVPPGTADAGARVSSRSRRDWPNGRAGRLRRIARGARRLFRLLVHATPARPGAVDAGHSTGFVDFDRDPDAGRRSHLPFGLGPPLALVLHTEPG